MLILIVESIYQCSFFFAVIQTDHHNRKCFINGQFTLLFLLIFQVSLNDLNVAWTKGSQKGIASIFLSFLFFLMMFILFTKLYHNVLDKPPYFLKKVFVLRNFKKWFMNYFRMLNLKTEQKVSHLGVWFLLVKILKTWQ